jgi:hypothetical protein
MSEAEAIMTLQELVKEIQQLSVDERKALINIISDSLDEPKRYSILEFQGIEHDLLNGMDAQEYVNGLRDEWDERERNFRK